MNRAMSCTPYFSEDAAIKLRQYRYVGADTSITYKFFYNPLATKLVTYLPEWLA